MPIVLPLGAAGCAGASAKPNPPAARAGTATGAAPAAPPAEQVVSIIATAEVRGTTEPCGCTSDPLGDIARIAKLGEGGLWVDAGSLLADEVEAQSGARVQARFKAEALGKIAAQAHAVVGLGAGDLVFGTGEVAPPRVVANVEGARFVTEPVVREVHGVKVGVFGVASPARVKALTASAPLPAARAAAAALRARGAQVVVGLFGMSRAEVLGLVERLPGVDVAVVGAEVGEGMPEPQPVARADGGTTLVVAPADQGRRVARVDLHVRKGLVSLALIDGAGARTRELARVVTRQRALTDELARWKKDPTADPAFLKAREDELAELARRHAELERPLPPPPPDAPSYATYELQPVRRILPRDAGATKLLAELAQHIGKENLALAERQPPPAPEPGKPTFVGVQACAKCHKAAVTFWQKTRHAAAWSTLTQVGRQYDYDCTGCHVTGWMRPGGAHLASVEKKGLVNVQCEVCHGPGSKHVAESGMEEPATLVRRSPDRFCADNCHTREHSDTFELEAYLRDVLGPGHGEKRRAALGDGPTGHELRARALDVARDKDKDAQKGAAPR